MSVKTRNLLIALIVPAAVAVAGCGGASDVKGEAAASGGSGEKGTLSLVAYSTPQVVYDELIPAFGKTPEGADVGFKTSFGASGDQARAVEAGQEADVVTFSTEPDMTRLVDAGIVDPDWKQGSNEGLVTTSVVSFVVHEGNPKNIKTWDDLLEPGVEVLTPNPFSSGAAKWNLLAGYGWASEGGKNPEAGLDYVRKLITEHVKVQDKSGREALQNFIGGNGDVLLSYEYEAITANKNGEKLEYVIPDDTIKINIDIATTKDAPAEAKSFLDYVLSEDGQQKFAEWGYRPVNEEVLAANEDRFPNPPGLFTIEDLGGWDKVNDELFDIEGGSIAKIEEDAGVSTAK
ncbi:MAG TPA: sulfate ABC transporter substrate-binding protein [Solirubrobacteraceae bacterium]|nr:sulfate ABC transporter substrate-binding protein [Solirubrobacteraceae bacterium]